MTWGPAQNTLIDELYQLPADLPCRCWVGRDESSSEFIQKLVDDAPNHRTPAGQDRISLTRDTFVTHGEILRADGGRTPVPGQSDPRRQPFVDTKGTLEGTTELVLEAGQRVDLSSRSASASRSPRLCRAT